MFLSNINLSEIEKHISKVNQRNAMMYVFPIYYNLDYDYNFKSHNLLMKQQQYNKIIADLKRIAANIKCEERINHIVIDSFPN